MGAKKWAGNIENGFAGIEGKTKPCYAPDTYTTVYFLTNSKLEDVVEMKGNIRELFPIGNHSIHITDTKEEAVQLANIILNDNSVQLLNYGNPYVYPDYNEKLHLFCRAVKESGRDPDDFIIDSGSVLALYGLRDTNDINYYVFEESIGALPASDIFEQHVNYNYYFYSVSLEALVFDPQNYMYFEGMKFVSLRKVKEMKSKRNAAKDVDDVKLIRKIERKAKKTIIPQEKREHRKTVILNYAKRSTIGRFMLKIYKKLRSIL